MSDRVGYVDQLGVSGLEGIASSEGLELISITIASDSRDLDNSVTTTHRKYLVMGLNDDKTYSAYNSTTHTEADVVVLAEEVEDVDHGATVAKAVFAGSFKAGYIQTPTRSAAIDWGTDVQRIRVRNEG